MSEINYTTEEQFGTTPERKEKCYIAGKISNLPYADFKANFDQAKQDVIKLGFEPVSPTDLPHDHGKTWVEYMKEDITEMLKCTNVFVLRNFNTSKGAKIEIDLAMKLGLGIILQK